MVANAVDPRKAANSGRVLHSGDVARSVAAGLLALFMMATLIFPVALINKVIFVLLLVMMSLAPLASHGRVKIRSFSPIIVLAIFLYGFGLAQIGQTDPDLTQQLMLSVSLLMLIYLVDWYEIDLDYLIKVSGLVLCAYTVVAIYALAFAPGSALGGFLASSLLDYSAASVGQRSFSEDELFFFRIGPVPFLFIPYCLFLTAFLESRRVRDALAVTIIGGVIIISTSRALILGCLIGSAYLLMRRMRPVNRIIALCCGAVFVVLLASVLVTQTTIFSASDQGNSIKIGHFISFIEHMTPGRLFFGDGLAATYFSIGNNAVIPQTEITLIDMVRYFGLPLASLLYAALLFPSLRPSDYGGDNQMSVVLFLVYLLISLTNPVMFNSFGLLVVLWYWSRILGASPRRVSVRSASRLGAA